MVLISRNPYVRLLSAYLEKGPKNELTIYKGIDPVISADVYAEPSERFDGLVRKLWKLHKLLGGTLAR